MNSPLFSGQPMLPQPNNTLPPVTFMQGGGAASVQVDGGALLINTVHPDITAWEQMYRKRLPPEAYSTSVTQSRPVAFELGAYQVPDRMALLVYNLRPDVYRFSGIDVSNTVPVEERSYSTKMGFDVNISQVKVGNLRYELRPGVGSLQNQNLFASTSDLFRPTANAYGTADALQPQRPDR